MNIDAETQVLEYLKQGDLVYELYAVLVHSGSAIGGHYYAYIKSFEDGKWYNFNDSDVREIQQEDVTKVFGDKNGNATAYMLKYRQYNPAHKDASLAIDDGLVPEYLKQEIDSETCKMIEEQKQIEEKLLNIKLRIWLNDSQMKEVSVKKNIPLRDLYHQVANLFETPL